MARGSPSRVTKTFAEASRKSAERESGKRNRATHLTLRLTPKEMELLQSLASDQLFRREFIDPRLPGYVSNPDELRLAKKIVERLRLMTDRSKGISLPRRTGTLA